MKSKKASYITFIVFFIAMAIFTSGKNPIGGEILFLIVAIPIILLLKYVLIKLDEIKFNQELKDLSEKNGYRFNYQYKGYVALDSKVPVLYVSCDTKELLKEDDIISIEKSSILETKHNLWRMQFHKNKHCKLIINTTSLDCPIYTINFKDVKDLDVWYQRLSLVFLKKG